MNRGIDGRQAAGLFLFREAAFAVLSPFGRSPVSWSVGGGTRPYASLVFGFQALLVLTLALCGAVDWLVGREA